MDYSQIIESLKVDKVITLMNQLGAEKYIEREGYIIFPTICHNVNPSEASMKLYFYKDTKLFVCYTSCEKMSIFKFLKTYYETRQIEYDWYEDIYMVVKNCSYQEKEGFIKPYKSLKNRYNGSTRTKQLIEYPSEVLDCFIKHTYPEEWLKDGITKATMDKYDIRYSISQNKIIIPHRDINGRLIGIRGRALNEWEIENVGKYMPIKVEKTWYKHSLSMNLYGLYENQENIRKTRICYLVEAEKSVLQADSFSMPNCCVAICGSSFNIYQLNLLLKHCAPMEIVICFDKEDRKGEDTQLRKICSIGRKYSNKCNFSYVRDMTELLKLKDSPTDKGEDIFQYLLSNRKKII